MNNPKLLEAIAELEAQRQIIDNAILHLRKAVEALGGSKPGIVLVPSDQQAIAPRTGNSYPAQAEQAIVAAGHSLHIDKILDYIASVRGERPARSSVESGIVRDISKRGNDSRLVRSGKSTYDLRKSLPIAS